MDIGVIEITKVMSTNNKLLPRSSTHYVDIENEEINVSNELAKKQTSNSISTMAGKSKLFKSRHSNDKNDS